MRLAAVTLWLALLVAGAHALPPEPFLITTDAMAIAHAVISPYSLALLTSGSKAPKLTGHSKAAAVRTYLVPWGDGHDVLLTTGASAADAANYNFNVAKEPTPTYADISNTALGPNSHDAVVLDFWVRVTKAPAGSELHIGWFEFHTMELLPTVAARHAAGVVANDTMMVETNGTVNVRYSAATMKADMAKPKVQGKPPLLPSDRRPGGVWVLDDAPLTRAGVRVGDEYRIKIRLADVGDRIGESFIVLHNQCVYVNTPS